MHIAISWKSYILDLSNRSGRDGKMMSLAEMHYMKSAERFIKLDSSPEDILKVHLDHIVLLEDSLEGIIIIIIRNGSYRNTSSNNLYCFAHNIWLCIVNAVNQIIQMFCNKNENY